MRQDFYDISRDKSSEVIAVTLSRFIMINITMEVVDIHLWRENEYGRGAVTW
jgi:hypothetical protein